MFDAHVHLDFLTSAAAAQYVQRARGAGVVGFAIPGVSAAQWAAAERLARSIGGLWGCGIHPEYASQDEPAMSAEIGALIHHARETQPDFVGETGLDARLEPEPSRASVGFSKEAQERLFLAHVDLAESLDRPLVVHSVRRHARVLALIEGRDVRGMVHGFIGSRETAERFFARGWMLSAGQRAMRSPKTQRAFEAAPLDKILVESDEPGNESDLPMIADWLVEIRAEPRSVLASRTHQNALTLFASAR